MVYCNSMQENALPMGVSQIIASLREAGFNVDLFDTTFYKWDRKSSMEIRMEHLQFPSVRISYMDDDVYQAFRSKIESFSPDLIGFSIVEPTFLFSMKLLDSIRDVIRTRRIKIAVGGVHAIYAPETLIKNELIDFICIGEGEENFVGLCEKIKNGDDITGIAGFIIKTSKGHITNKTTSLVDINNLPILDFSLFGSRFLDKPMMGKVYRTISLELSRGCPYNCTYCGNSFLSRMFRKNGRWYRLKTIDKINREYDEYIKEYRPEFIYKHSESFLAVNKDRFNEYMEMYSDYAIPYWIETRPEDITEEKAAWLAKTNCKRISIGLESGNELFRKNVLKRNYSNDLVKKSCFILKDMKISFSMNLIIGFPDETRDTIFDGVELLREVKPDSISIFLFTPYRGCELRKICEERKMISPDFIGEDYFQMQYALENNSISCDELIGLFRTIPLYVQMPKSEFPRIKIAEKLNCQGNAMYAVLKNEYYKIKEWCFRDQK